ncbi:alpha-1,2-fucosyltransferase [Paenibacillus gansuensis]|uniref:Alpha-1,2-fucosyltransferase n=1 Tax=Paenibacillus gansuensis TaxID=306542 RepID=A0ABW5PD39_9BACL
MGGKHKYITMSGLGSKKHGRFGNQLLNYGLLKIYAAHYSLKTKTNPWIGQYLFELRDPLITHKFPTLREAGIQSIKENRLLHFKEPPYVDMDLKGNSMKNMSAYAPYKQYFRSLFQPAPHLNRKLRKGRAKLQLMGKTVVGIHIRRGDYTKYTNHPKYVAVPTSWYVEWLSRIWPLLDRPVLFLASDDLNAVKADFSKFKPVTSADLISSFPATPRYNQLDPSFYPDFYFLTQCDLLAISNSTFSFSASLLNERAKVFMRPGRQQKLVRYEPWKSSRKIRLR